MNNDNLLCLFIDNGSSYRWTKEFQAYTRYCLLETPKGLFLVFHLKDGMSNFVHTSRYSHWHQRFVPRYYHHLGRYWMNGKMSISLSIILCCCLPISYDPPSNPNKRFDHVQRKLPFCLEETIFGSNPHSIEQMHLTQNTKS